MIEFEGSDQAEINRTMSSRCLFATAGVVNATAAVPKALKHAAH
jgi:hypothetical protein